VAKQADETPLGFSWPSANPPLSDGALTLSRRRQRPLRVERSKPVITLSEGRSQPVPARAPRTLRDGATRRDDAILERLEELASTVTALRAQLAEHERRGHEGEHDALREVRALRAQVHRMLVDRSEQQARMQRDLQALTEAVRTLRRSPGIGRRGVDLDPAQVRAIGAAVARHVSGGHLNGR
jgi:hypothetical protein